jgi:hypothetical protein
LACHPTNVGFSGKARRSTDVSSFGVSRGEAITNIRHQLNALSHFNKDLFLASSLSAFILKIKVPSSGNIQSEILDKVFISSSAIRDFCKINEDYFAVITISCHLHIFDFSSFKEIKKVLIPFQSLRSMITLSTMKESLLIKGDSLFFMHLNAPHPYEIKANAEDMIFIAYPSAVHQKICAESVDGFVTQLQDLRIHRKHTLLVMCQGDFIKLGQSTFKSLSLFLSDLR